ncbi:ATP synthase F1 subunit epsilon [bacterium]|nr:ATP synthase F1 subunit epsilon [bacterium]PJA75788.1 MAG: ATP synthase F1 subunit epsilon [bacterium CG_4_9_14_3_um_filter_65_15]
MARTFKVVIVTPEKTAYEGESISAVIPGLAGYIGIWANHAPLVAAVAPGLVTLKKDDAGNELRMAVGTGFVEVSDNVVNLMVETCETDSEIDVARAEKALERARGRLTDMQAEIDRERARLALQRAEARVRAAKGK